MKRIYLLTTMLIWSVCCANAQVTSTANGLISFTGHVTDGKTGESMTGVSITASSNPKAAYTDKDGNFKIQLKPNSTITLFYVGYKKQVINVQDKKSLEIKMGTDITQLSEVSIVVGYGTQKRREVTGAVGSITAAQIDQHPSSDINTSLQGKIAGLQITSNSGEPGAGATVRIRGASSVNGSSQPLYIVDGIPINSETYSGGLVDDASTFSPLADINPSDIEAVEVLKDGAASIYGSRASNGVIIITTKTGKGLKKPQLKFGVNTSLVELTRKIGVLNGPQWRSAFIDAFFNSTGTMTPKESVVDSLHPYYSKSNDWQDIMYRQAAQYKADVSLAGGSKDNSVNYYVSAGYKNLNPIVKNTKYELTTATGKVYYTLSKYISGSTNFNLSSNAYSRILTGLSNQSVIYQALSTMPVYSPSDPFTGQRLPLFEGSKPNPLAISELAANNINRFRVFGSQDIKVQILKDLRFTTTLSFDYANTEQTNFTPQSLLPSGQISSTYLTSGKDNSIINENTLTYKLVLDNKHNFNFLLGQSYQKYNNNVIDVIGKGLMDSKITSINGASVVSLYNQNISENALLSFFGRANYDYRGKYLFSFIMRKDGSSRFGSENMFGYFPSVLGGWRFSDEDFAQNLLFLTEGKIRGSYGVTGNQSIGNYAAKGSLITNGTYLGNLAVIAGSVPNNTLQWENTKQANIGIDLGFLQNRLRFTADAYLKRTTNLLFETSVPGTTGYETVPNNFGSLQNKGFEISLNTVNLNKALQWNTAFTLALNQNKMLSLPGTGDYRPNMYNIARVGQPVGVFYGLKSKGIYASDSDNVYSRDGAGNVTPYKQGSANGKVYKGGDVIWEDVNGDGIINDDDLQIIGNPNPKFSGGLQNDFTYKNFNLNILFTYSFGNDVFNEVKRNLDSTPYDQNFTTDQLRRWRNQGDVTDIPRLVKTDPMLNNAISDRFVEDGSFIRLQSLSLNYKLPNTWLKKLNVNTASVGFTAVNLLTFSSYTGYDPEVSSSTNSLSAGVDRGAFPKSRSYNLSLNLNF